MVLKGLCEKKRPRFEPVGVRGAPKMSVGVRGPKLRPFKRPPPLSCCPLTPFLRTGKMLTGEVMFGSPNLTGGAFDFEQKCLMFAFFKL